MVTVAELQPKLLDILVIGRSSYRSIVRQTRSDVSSWWNQLHLQWGVHCFAMPLAKCCHEILHGSHAFRMPGRNLPADWLPWRRAPPPPGSQQLIFKSVEGLRRFRHILVACIYVHIIYIYIMPYTYTNIYIYMYVYIISGIIIYHKLQKYMFIRYLVIFLAVPSLLKT